MYYIEHTYETGEFENDQYHIKTPQINGKSSWRFNGKRHECWISDPSSWHFL